MPMSSEAKAQLSKSIRSLREQLLTGLHEAMSRSYLLQVEIDKAKLDEPRRRRRERLEQWLDEQCKPLAEKARPQAAQRFRLEVEKEAAYTLLNRLVFLRLTEASGLSPIKVVTGGWSSEGYSEFRDYATDLLKDETQGYAYLLHLVFEEWALDMPGLFGDVGLTSLVPIPPEILRAVVEELDREELKSCWTDDMTLGWVYQYWNDPEREALDAKINSGGKIAAHEIASKTQMFTERYMVEWLLQNSLGQTWFALCQKHSWTPLAVQDGTLTKLEQRRIEWRAKREAGEVELTALMPIHNEQEQLWKYWVKQPMPEDAPGYAPESLRQLKLLDPACGSGHFLVVAFDMLFQLYKEEAQHRGENWTDKEIVEWILENNLHGLDIDPRAVQIAAAALLLKARQLCPEASPYRLNLVASQFRIGSLPKDDPAILDLKSEVKKAAGVPEDLTQTILDALSQADYMGSLLQVDAAVVEAIQAQEAKGLTKTGPVQGEMFKEAPKPQIEINFEAAKKSIERELDQFLEKRTSGRDLGLRLRGKQLAAGLRFVRLVQPGQYDLVVGNPPYQGSSKLKDSTYLKAHYPRGKADLYAAFLQRGLELAKKGGMSALLTMRNWMFTKHYSELRQWLLDTFDLRSLGDFAIGAFDEVPNDILSVCASTFRKKPAKFVTAKSVALQPTPPDDVSYDRQRTSRKRAAVLSHFGRYVFAPSALEVVPEWPLVYWWNRSFLKEYANSELVGNLCPAMEGWSGSDNARVLRTPSELPNTGLGPQRKWAPYIGGAGGHEWFEPLRQAINWKWFGLEMKVSSGYYFRNESHYFGIGVSFTTVGSKFGARAHTYPSVFGSTGRSMFPANNGPILCSLNTNRSRRAIEDLNPTIHFTVGGVNSLPVLEVNSTNSIHAVISLAFATHETHREASVEFKAPGPSPWRHAQDWAQEAVDRPEGAPLPPYEAVYDPEPATDHVSFALGVALGRFGRDGEGILDPDKDDLSQALPHGILFLNEAHPSQDSLSQEPCQFLKETWTEKQPEIDSKTDLRTYLREKFFNDVHKSMYENRPIHWPLSSAKKTFVAWINIHRWNSETLRVLLADHLKPAEKSLSGELDDLGEARKSPDKKTAKNAEKRYFKVKKWLEELFEFIKNVNQCAEKGPPPTGNKCPAREVDAAYDPVLDDGVMINSAALWPLLQPQWKDPKKWWKELASAKGKKDYDWSHLAMRTFPTRVDEKCQEDPSLAVAHGCFWRYHPQWAYRWELRLQPDLGLDFKIDEDGSDQAREDFQRHKPELALSEVSAEVKRRHRKDKDAVPNIEIPHGLLWSLHPALTFARELAIQNKHPGFSLKESATDSAVQSFFKDQAPQALAIIEEEYGRRYAKKKKDNPDITIDRSGLWQQHPEACFDLELKLRQTLNKSFALHAPGSSKARTEYMDAHPDKAQAWAALGAGQKIQGKLFKKGG